MRTLIASLLCVVFSLSFSTHAAAQPIYAENQLPSRGVDIAYTVIIKNPTSHLYDIAMSIKGIRETTRFCFDAGLVSRHISHRELCAQHSGFPRVECAQPSVDLGANR